MNYAVLGAFFGDEGKGQTVHNICKNIDAHMVVRFSGGHQVGHTVRMKQDVGYIEHTFSNFGSGTLLGIPTYWSKFCTVDPTAARIEYEELTKLGFKPEIHYSPACEVVLPYDRVEQITDKINLEHGTVGTGFKKCLDRAAAGYHLTVLDCLNLNVLRWKVISILAHYYKHLQSDDSLTVNIDQWCLDAYEYFQNAGIVTESWIPADRVVFEGSQGILLDQTYGIMPFCTPSNTTCKNIAELCPCQLTPIYVTRPYITRHGNGPIPSVMEVMEVKDINNPYNDFQKSMRAVKFDMSLLEHSMDINAFSYRDLMLPYIAVTHMDEYPDFRVNSRAHYFEYEKELRVS